MNPQGAFPGVRKRSHARSKSLPIDQSPRDLMGATPRQPHPATHATCGTLAPRQESNLASSYMSWTICRTLSLARVHVADDMTHRPSMRHRIQTPAVMSFNTLSLQDVSRPTEFALAAAQRASSRYGCETTAMDSGRRWRCEVAVR